MIFRLTEIDSKVLLILALAASQILMMVGMYYISAAIVTGTQDYHFILSPLFVFKEIGYISISAIPMLAFFWMLSVCIQTPIFSIGIGLASIVPSVLMINTKAKVQKNIKTNMTCSGGNR